jgi:uncharacterized protein (DUF885 family)
LKPLGFDTNKFSEFVEVIKKDPRFYVKTSNELLQVYKDVVDKISTVLPQYFQRFPQSPLEIHSMEYGPAGFYMVGTADGKRPGRFSIGVSNIEQRPTFEKIALTLHEAIPGHHHQLSLLLENLALPKFLRYIEDRRYDICPCKKTFYTAFLEGWALYSEFLGEEMGLYENPYDMFGRLSMEMMRAVRFFLFFFI